MIIVAANTDDLFDAVVVGGYFFIGERPVFLDALQRPLFEISRSIAQGYGVPMQGSAPKSAHSIDRYIVGIGIGDRFCNVPLIKGYLLLSAESPKGQFVRPLVREQLPPAVLPFPLPASLLLRRLRTVPWPSHRRRRRNR